MNFRIIGSLIVYLFPVAFIIVIWKKILHKEEINFLDLLLTVYVVIWILILTTIGYYSVTYYAYVKNMLGIKEEYLWALLILVAFLAIYNFYLWWKISKAKERRLDKW